MSRQVSKNTRPQPPKNEKRRGVPAILGCVVLAALVVGFLISERCGLTGTHFIFKDEAPAAETQDATSAELKAAAKRGETPSADGKKKTPSAKKSAAGTKKSDAADGKSAEREPKSSRKAKSEKTSVPAAKKDAQPTVPPLPRSAFPEISRRPQTWPVFVRLTRSRSIAIVDPQSGVSMGRMEVPAGTVVKVRKVGADGMLDVFDRTGQAFKIDASGTNFAAALEAVKISKVSKAKKKTKPKKAPETVAKTEPAPEAAPKAADAQPAGTPKTPKKFISVFGTVSEDDWDDADDE